jgi:zinc finger MYND domain-containing protein 10
LILGQQWKERVFPAFKKEFILHNSMGAYFTLYHEATIVNLLQVILYHPGSCKEAGEAILDLIHYIFNKIQAVQNWKHTDHEEKLDLSELMNRTEIGRFEDSIRETEFSISMNCLCILRSITDQINEVPLSALNLLLIEKDMIVALVQLLESSPWIRKRKDLERFEIGGWSKIKHDDLEVVSKLEGQIWLALMNLLLEPECKKKYQYSKQNQSTVLKLKEFISPNTVDQLPPLVDLQRYLEELLMMSPPDYISSQSGIQPVSEIYTEIMDNVNIDQIIVQQRRHFLGMNEKNKKTMASRYSGFIRLARMYDFDGVEELIQEPKCGNCGLPADQRCSLCKSEWYCGRSCQVKAWKNHKPICELLREAAKNKQ